MTEKIIELGEIDRDFDINPSDYTDFFGEVDGCFYPYITIDYQDGYTCGRCNGPCDRDRDPQISASITIWETNNE